MRSRLLLLLLVMLTLGSIQSVFAQQPAHRIIFQLATDDTLAWKGLMKNVKHLKEGWGDSLAIEIVAHGPGLNLLVQQKTTQWEAIKKFKAMGIDFVACENTMKERSISRESIIPEARFVRMGLGEVVLKQEAGWTYLKAGL